MSRLLMTLNYGNRSVDVMGLLDSGSAVNVLPYGVGLALGANWAAHTTRIPLAGHLGGLEARGIFVKVRHPQLTPGAPVRLVFAWTRAENVPLLFGQVNFFAEFDVCFYRTEGIFEVAPRRS